MGKGWPVCPFFFHFINCLRTVLFFLYPIVPSLRGRIAFEGKNIRDPACRSFAGEGRIANYAFEVSSEGELEQVYPLIERVLGCGGCVEVLFASPSVEGKCLELYESNSRQVRILRLPLLTFFPWRFGRGQNIAHWMSAPVLILCRYDFYPELFLYGTRKGHRFYLVSAVLKNKGRLWLPLYRCFDKIVCSNRGEWGRFVDWGWPREKLAYCEFRSIRILSRLKDRHRVFSHWEQFTSWIATFAGQNRLIVGNAWPAEMDILHGDSLQKNVKKGKFLVLVAPHKMGEAFVKGLEEKMKNFSVHILSRPEEWESVLARWKISPGPLVFAVSGVLLEFYSLFRHALVGGGHGKGVHSLLEPFWAGCSIYCGSEVGRSSEYDFVQQTSPDCMTIVADWKQWTGPESDTNTNANTNTNTEEGLRDEFSPEHYRNRFDEIATWLLEE